MSRRSRLARAERRASPVSAEPAAIPAASASSSLGYGGGWGNNGHNAADWSRLRGYVYFPQLDTRREITPYTRVEVMRKSRYFCANCGLPRRIIYGLSRLVAGSGLTPHALTTDRVWNKASEAYFASRAESPFIFDVGGRFDFYSAQPFVLSAHYRDGDQATIQTESATAQAMFAFYEGHQVASGNAEVDASVIDGVRLNSQNRALAYRFVDADGNPTEVPAENVIFMSEYERAGQSRSTSILEHALNHFHDKTDILSYIKTGVKLSNLFGYWVEKQATVAGGPPSAYALPGNVQKVDMGNGQSVTLDQIIGGGAIPELGPGMTLKFNSNQHPHPNNLNLLDYLIRDIAWGVGVAPDLLWNIAALGGANTRFVLADAQSWIEKEQQKLIRVFCQRVWTYTIAKALKTGKLPPCKDPEWWKVGWIPPPRLTVDFGRDGKLYIAQHHAGMLTLKTIYGWQGQDWQPQVDQVLDEVAYYKAGLNAQNAKARTDKDRNLTWDDIQHYRNSMGSRVTTGQSGGDSSSGDISGNPSTAAAQLSEIAKDPARAAAFLRELAAQPIPA